MKITCELTPEQVEKFKAFRDRKYAELAEQQKGSDVDQFVEGNVPYLGAIGGGTTWHITHYSIGTGISVTVLGEELDLTDVETW